jgi:hypothetical protein
MKGKFFWKVIIFIASLIIADRVIGLAMNYAIHKQRNGKFYEFRYKLTQAKPAIAILGSSRANHHYNIGLIEQSTHENSMNYGQDGTSVFTHYIVLKTLLRRYKPKLVVLDIKPGDFDQMQNFNEVASLYPIIDEIAIDGDDLEMISAYEKLKLYCQCYKYNNEVLEIIGGMYGKTVDTLAITGFSPLAVKNVVLDNGVVNDSGINSNICRYFTRIIALCKLHNVKLIVCTSPCYRRVVFDRTIAVAEALCKKNGIDYINYLNNKLLPFDASMFKDEFHLNAKGADIFTKDFIGRLPPFGQR